MTDRQQVKFIMADMDVLFDKLIEIRDKTENEQLKYELKSPINELTLEDLQFWCHHQSGLRDKR